MSSKRNSIRELEANMQALQPTVQVNLSRRYTLEELWALPEREDRAYYELIEGYLYVVPPATSPHDRLDSRLNQSLIRFLTANNIEADVYHPRAGIYRTAEYSTYLEPDMMYVSNLLQEQMGEKRTSADIVFEFISRGTRTYDYTTKANAYLNLGVRELWLVDRFKVTIEVRHSSKMDETPIWEIVQYSRGEHAKSRVLAGWEVSIDELFQDLV
jgi:Uma2 family endonuclease